PLADLVLTQSRVPDAILLGQSIPYSLQITNLGPNTASSVALTNVLPSGVTVVSINPSQGACSYMNGVVNCNLGNLAAGAHALVQISYIPGLTGVNSNFAMVSAAELDPV